MSKDDLIDMQGTVVAVHSGGLYRVQCDAGHEVLAQLSGRMRRFRIKVVPVRLDGLQNVLRVGWHMARPGRVRVAFGAPLRLTGDDYEGLAKKVEAAVRTL